MTSDSRIKSFLLIQNIPVLIQFIYLHALIWAEYASRYSKELNKWQMYSESATISLNRYPFHMNYLIFTITPSYLIVLLVFYQFSAVYSQQVLSDAFNVIHSIYTQNYIIFIRGTIDDRKWTCASAQQYLN